MPGAGRAQSPHGPRFVLRRHPWHTSACRTVAPPLRAWPDAMTHALAQPRCGAAVARRIREIPGASAPRALPSAVAAGLAQLVEQLSCKQQVIGSSPIAGSTCGAPPHGALDMAAPRR